MPKTRSKRQIARMPIKLRTWVKNQKVTIKRLANLKVELEGAKLSEDKTLIGSIERKIKKLQTI
jgi:hypothetical protein